MAGVDLHALQTNFLANCLVIGSAGTSLLVALVAVLRRALAPFACPSSVQWILVPGHALSAGYPSMRFRARLDRAAWIALRHSGARVLILGGKRSGASGSEAAAGRDHLEARGLARCRISVEERSRNTLENFQQARTHLDCGGGSARVLVTSRYHIARSEAMARGLGLRVVTCPAEDRPSFSLGMLCLLIWEAYLLHWYEVGRIYASMTGNAAMLERIRGQPGGRP